MCGCAGVCVGGAGGMETLLKGWHDLTCTEYQVYVILVCIGGGFCSCMPGSLRVWPHLAADFLISANTKKIYLSVCATLYNIFF